METDTISIDSLTKKAYNNARINPEWSISISHKALIESRELHFQKGIADACLALGTAYLAKYNPNDSAGYFYHQALSTYSQLNDVIGQARACYGLSYLYNFKSQPQKAEEFGNLSVKYFEQSGSTKGVVSALGSVIFLAKLEGDYEKALELSDKAIQLARSIKDTLQWANALNNKGNVLKDMFLLNPATDAYFEAYRLWKFSNDSSGLAIAYGSIANAFFFEGDYRKSLEYNFKKLLITQNTGNLWETNKTMNNIAMAYSNLDQHDNALHYMQKSLKLAKQIGYPEGIANCYDNMASAYFKMCNSDSALFYSSIAVTLAKKINSPKLAKYELNKAMAFNQQKEYNKALAIAKKAYNRAKQKNDNHVLKDASFLLNDIYYHLGQRDLAYPFLAEYLRLDDSLSNIEYMRKVTRLDIQYKYEKKQKAAEFEIEKSRQQIEILNKTNQIKSQRIKIFWIFSIAIILLSLAGAFISSLVIRNQNHRIEQMKLEIRNYLYQLKKDKVSSKHESPLSELAKNYNLTQREIEIMELIATGIGNEQIAEKLFVSKNTIKFHIKNIFIKLDVRNRVQALQKMAG